jgi:beta-lactamase class A
VGVYALVIQTGEAVSYHGEDRYPMQSVYKFPIGMAVLDRVDKGSLSLDREIRVDTSEYIPESGHSPLRDKLPEGTRLTVRQLLNCSVAESDGTACDVLLRLPGGTEKAREYVCGLGIQHIAIATTEQVQIANDLIQYRNWATPKAMSALFRIFYSGNALSEESKEVLLKYLSVSGPWFDRRIKGLLPKGIPVFHKTGTSGTLRRLTRATNDAGIIVLPNGQHVALSVFIADAYAIRKDREVTIAKISRAIYDYYAIPGRQHFSTSASR